MKEGCPIGVGLRPLHYPYLETKPRTAVKWFEVISENYMDTEGRPLKMLEFFRQDYPISLHGVSLSIGSESGLSRPYLEKLKVLIDRIDPFQVSDHLCWTGLPEANLHNLLPVVYTQETLKKIVRHVDEVQTFLGRQIALENLSAYFSFRSSTYTEWDFFREVALRSGCLLLLDINNIYVNSVNQKFDPLVYLDAIPSSLVAEIHLAGFTDMGDYLFDTHSAPVFPQVWDLLKKKIKDYRHIPLLVEWDEDVPEFPVLEREALLAKKIWEDCHGS